MTVAACHMVTSRDDGMRMVKCKATLYLFTAGCLFFLHLPCPLIRHSIVKAGALHVCGNPPPPGPHTHPPYTTPMHSTLTLTHTLSHTRTHSLKLTLTHFPHLHSLLTHPPHSLIYLLAHSLTHFACSRTHLFTHSRTHTLIFCCLRSVQRFSCSEGLC